MATRKLINTKVKELNALLGLPAVPVTGAKHNVGHIGVEYSKKYGGYSLGQITSPEGEITCTVLGRIWFGNRLPAKSMGMYLNGLLDGLQYQQEKP